MPELLTKSTAGSSSLFGVSNSRCKLKFDKERPRQTSQVDEVYLTQNSKI